jgi:hypothetical protein
MKVCFKCGESKERTEFYAHLRMGDGLLGKCKACTKRDVSARYEVCRAARAEYERKRLATPRSQGGKETV